MAMTQEMPAPSVTLASAMMNPILPGFDLQQQSYICSIWPGELTFLKNCVTPNESYRPDAPIGTGESSPFRNFSTWKLGPPPKDGYVVMPVYHSWQWINNPHPDPDIGMQKIPGPIPCDSLAKSMVRSWVDDSLHVEDGQGRPGVAIIVGPKPTDEELATLRAQQATYFKHLIHLADGYHYNREFKKITNLFLKAAEWMGVHDREWKQEITHRGMKDCPACAEPILEKATICKHCRTDLRSFKPGDVPEMVDEPEGFVLKEGEEVVF